jgi:hypothetical protein
MPKFYSIIITVLYCLDSVGNHMLLNNLRVAVQYPYMLKGYDYGTACGLLSTVLYCTRYRVFGVISNLVLVVRN